MTINIKASKDLNVFDTREKRLYPNSPNWPRIYRTLQEQGYRMCYGILAVDSKINAAVGYQIILRNDNRNCYLVWLDPNHQLSKLVRMKMIKATKEYLRSEKRYHMSLKMILLEDETESKQACQEITSMYAEMNISVSAQGMRKNVNCFKRPIQARQMFYEVTSSVFNLQMLGFEKLYHVADNKIADATILLNVRKDPKERYQVAGYANIKKWHSCIVLKELVLHETRKKDMSAFLKDGVNLYKRDVWALVPEGQYENISVFEEAGFKRACIEFTLTF